MPEGGLGNLVALSMQGQARKMGNSVFVDYNFEMYLDQWGYIQNMKQLSLAEVKTLISRHGGQEPLGQMLKSSEMAPWDKPQVKSIDRRTLPSRISIVRSSGLFIPVNSLPARAINHLKRLATFKNPEYYTRLGMRLPTFNIPRIISCGDFVDDYLVLPRGCEDAVMEFFKGDGVEVRVENKTNPDSPIDVKFVGVPRTEQANAVETLSQHRCGTIYAATAFGKTVTGIAMIARMKVNTLILVHTKALLDQWRNKLEEFLETDFKPEEEQKGRGRRKMFKQFGALSSGENLLNGKIDIALLQSCISDNEVKPFVRDYGMVIVDECHHAPAVNFERVLKEVNARYVYGFTATPIRKDGHQPIIFMQCGEIRFTADSMTQRQAQSFDRVLIPRYTTFRCLKADGGNFTQVIDELIEDEARNQLILKNVEEAVSEGRTPIIITDRKSHVDYLVTECRKFCRNVIRLVGNDSAKVKCETMAHLAAISDDEPLVVVATGKYVGEGYDLPRLDTLMLALPVSWKGLITQYTGRLHREYPGKKEVRIYDYVDLRSPICDSMYRKRLNGFKAVGYTVEVAGEGLFAERTAQTIFDADNFAPIFHTDIASATRSIIIAVNHLRWTRAPRIIELLQNAISHGVGVTIVISEIGFQEEQLKSLGANVIYRETNKLNCAIIDKSICWYGTPNFLTLHRCTDPILRLTSTPFATALLSPLLD